MTQSDLSAFFRPVETVPNNLNPISRLYLTHFTTKKQGQGGNGKNSIKFYQNSSTTTSPPNYYLQYNYLHYRLRYKFCAFNEQPSTPANSHDHETQTNRSRGEYRRARAWYRPEAS